MTKLDPTDAMLDAAAARGQERLANEPRAVAVRYDARSDRMIVDLANGCTFAFPPKLVQGLGGSSEKDLAQAEILGAGFALSWEDPDVQISVASLLSGVFGTRAYMARELARRAGSTSSAAKRAAARANGAKGGRPRKTG